MKSYIKSNCLELFYLRYFDRRNFLRNKIINFTYLGFHNTEKSQLFYKDGVCSIIEIIFQSFLKNIKCESLQKALNQLTHPN